jgi:hypothetical protein
MMQKMSMLMFDNSGRAAYYYHRDSFSKRSYRSVKKTKTTDTIRNTYGTDTIYAGIGVSGVTGVKLITGAYDFDTAGFQAIKKP